MKTTNIMSHLMKHKWAISLLLLLTPITKSALAQGNQAPIVEVEMVTVGDAGNPADTSTSGDPGAVAYEYEIGKYEVTNEEYVKFLNAVDPKGLNILALYNLNMTRSSVGGLSFSLIYAPGARYQVKSGFDRRPVTYVSLIDCMRFCNWLHNGAQVGSDTENGAYTLEGGVSRPTNFASVIRNAGAKFVVPTLSEWHKAASYQPAADGGDSDGYWTYATSSNTVPNASLPPGAAPAANYDRLVVVGDNVGLGFTDVGSYSTTVNYYGTFDMAGNAAEWGESIVGFSNLRPVLGESFSSRSLISSSSSTATAESLTRGFRIVGL